MIARDARYGLAGPDGDELELAPAARDSSRAMCEGKHKFTNPARAEKVAKRMRRRHDRSIGAYRCHCCHRWHVGQQEKWQLAKRRDS